jgi:ATP-dependent DNA helicase RecG
MVGSRYDHRMARSDEELEVLLRDTESDLVERKAALSDKAKVCQAICAFANDLPQHRTAGVIFIGADDRTGRPAGLPITDELLRELADLRDLGEILPRPTMVVRKRRLLDADVAVIEVAPAVAPPVRYKGQVWIRIGPRRAIATQDDERQLSERRRAADLPFDARPVAGTTPADLDLDLFTRDYLPAAVAPAVLEQNGRSVVEQLTAVRFASSDAVPTAAGIVVVGIDPTAWLPGAAVQFLRIAGTELGDPVTDEKRLDGPLVDVLRLLDELLQINVTTAVDVLSEAKEIRRSDYPLAALQQLVRNAVLHRSYENTSAPVRLTWYDDRVEVFSPGGPYGVVNVENFGRPGVTDYRNPTLAEAMRSLGYVQRFGFGIPLAMRALRENGNPAPEFAVAPTHVGVIVRSLP